MLDKSHDAVIQPQDNLTLWRYMSFPKLCGVLETSTLAFPRADQFEDPYEGSWSSAGIKQLEEDACSGKIGAADAEALIPHARRTLRCSVANCLRSEALSARLHRSTTRRISNMNNPVIPTDMLAAIKNCDSRMDAIVEELAKHPDTQRTPSVAYHYTDGTGLFGILENRTIRLTDIYGLNDPTEVLHGVKSACEILTAEAAKGHPAAETFAQLYAKFPNSLQLIAHWFVGCFSRNGDDLGQWRGYANNGHGFALGFDTELLEKPFISPPGSPVGRTATFSVRYNDAALGAIHRRLAQEVVPLLALPKGRNLSDAVVSEFMRQLSIYLSAAVVRAALFFKHEGYRNESEYRFLQLRSIGDSLSDLKLRARGHSLIRFTEFHWKAVTPSPLREVVLGPAVDEDAGREFVAACLKHADIDPAGVRVGKSSIPYRG
jgi:hypothetical protein